MKPGEPWYREWFGEEYLQLYPHRDEAEARDAVALFLRERRPPAGARVLDLGCGAGRHLEALGEAGLRPVGLDLSMPLLRRARESVGDHTPLVRGDMRRLPLADGSVDAATSFFTSFGYFAEPEDDRLVAREVRRVLGESGGFLLDFLNAARVRRELVPEDERTIGGRQVRQLRRIQGDMVVKRIEIRQDEGPPEVFHERVRLYGPGELTRLLAEAGLEVERRFGDYGGAEHDAGSPRLILTGRAR